MLLEMGYKLYAQGILENPDDIFFVTLEEIRPADEYHSIEELRHAIAHRRSEYEQNLKLRPPHIVIGIYRPQEPIIEEAADVKILEGLTVSGGKAVGKARVILRTNEKEQVLPGEILVAPFTDPAWTPYFMTAAGIVIDQGGLLSHGSIVAREYGIPAVVNVGPATEIIKTGQMIEVDGDRGIVRILS
jgi:pyruvate,water dikinase